MFTTKTALNVNIHVTPREKLMFCDVLRMWKTKKTTEFKDGIFFSIQQACFGYKEGLDPQLIAVIFICGTPEKLTFSHRFVEH